ncbi:MAG TPA: DUF6049 family protein [Streptosporangiaceae bacterium]
MPRQPRPPGPARPAIRRVCLPLLALTTAVAWALLMAVPAMAAGTTAQRDPPAGVSIVITSMNPTIASPKGTVTVSGTVTNAAAAPVTGVQIQLWSASVRLATRSAMESYLTALGPTGLDSPTGPVLQIASLAGHTPQTWSLTLRVSDVGMTGFGVYPLAAELTQGLATLATFRTFLPFWPGNAAYRSVKPLAIAWVWPLIDMPHRAACPALLTNSLAASLASGGRLSQLLAAGTSPFGQRAQLTWAIDPALLADAKTMTAPYQVGGTATCAHPATHPASAAAQAWLRAVKTVAGQQDFFVTPYADVDVAALAHHGPDGDLPSTFSDGRAEAQAVLGQVQRTAAAPSSGKGAPGLIDWPADGLADYGVLERLAASGIGTVILDSTMMRPTTPFTPTAVTTTLDGLGTELHVFLADNALARILALPPTSLPGASASTATGVPAAVAAGPGATFARTQWFLAETAMITAEAPSVPRAVVITPPRQWDPGPLLAHDLLAATTETPWLRPSTLAGLITTAPPSGHPDRKAPPEHQVSPDELSSSLLRQVRRLDGQIKLLGSILTHPGRRYLSTATAAIESSAWRGSKTGKHQAEQLLHRVTAYVNAQLQLVSLVDQGRVTLGGKSGPVAVSVSNRLGQAIQVRLRVSPARGDQVTIGKYNSTVQVAAGTQTTVKIPVRATAAGSTTLYLWLTTPDGRRLPYSTARLTVEATNFGTMAIVIIGIALGVFVLTAAARAVRSGRGQPGGDPDETGETEEADPTGPDLTSGAAGADSVEPEREHPTPAKEPDEHASIPGRAERR